MLNRASEADSHDDNLSRGDYRRTGTQATTGEAEQSDTISTGAVRAYTLEIEHFRNNSIGEEFEFYNTKKKKKMFRTYEHFTIRTFLVFGRVLNC